MKIMLTTIFSLVFFAVLAQEAKNTKSQLDFNFWIGSWDTEMSTGPKWEIRKGIDSVRSLLNGRLIEEIFRKPQNGQLHNFQRGYLTYLHRDAQWKHTIYDERWGEYTFKGKKEGDKMILYSDPHETRQGQRREIFYNITKNTFDYLWESSNDGGKTWQPMWRVHYIRKIS